jgi:hypothetical protein
MMHTNLTAKLAGARARASIWSETVLFELAAAITQVVKGSRWDWDADAGEEWGRIVVGSSIVALLWVRGPFLFLGEPWRDPLEGILGSYDLVVESVPDWETRAYSLDPGAVQALFGRDELTKTLNLACFSASELWWATI